MKNKIRSRLIKIARNCLGAPYKYGAKPEDAPKCFDCSSFTQYIYKKIGLKLPRSSILQAAQGRNIEMEDGEWRLSVGDLLFWRGDKGHYDDSLFGGEPIYIGHVAMYLGDGKIIQASSAARSVSEKLLAEVKEPIALVKRIL